MCIMLTDNHCQRLVEEGIVEHLVEILKEHRDHEADMTLQHAILSALRNLAIPGKLFFSHIHKLSPVTSQSRYFWLSLLPL